MNQYRIENKRRSFDFLIYIWADRVTLSGAEIMHFWLGNTIIAAVPIEDYVVSELEKKNANLSIPEQRQTL